MEVDIQRSFIIKGEAKTNTEIPLTIFDRFATRCHIAVLYSFSSPVPSNKVLVNSLVETLRYFPTLEGEFSSSSSGQPCLLLGGSNGGALLVEAEVASSLSDHLPLQPSRDFLLLHPPAEGEPLKLLQVQLNRFRCGGMVIGVTAHHRVADGQSMSSFYVAWGKIARGLSLNPLPIYGKPWLCPRQPPACEFNHWGMEFIPSRPEYNENGFSLHPNNTEPSSITNLLLHYSSDFIATKLKPGMSSDEKFTTFETVLGHLWRKITIARGLKDQVQTQVRVSVNGRPRLRPPSPKEFFGNLVLNAYPRSSVKELVSGGTLGASRIVHDAIRRIDHTYFQSFIDFGEMYGGEDLVPCYDEDGNVLSPNLEVDSWLGFRFEDVDFGGGGAICGFLPTWVPLEGLVIFIPSLHADGGIHVLVTLLHEHADVLRQISYSLD